jgi:hypothetical protein
MGKAGLEDNGDELTRNLITLRMKDDQVGLGSIVQECE